MAIIKERLSKNSERKSYVKAYGQIIELQDYRIKWLARIVYSSQFELVIAFIILVNAVSLALLTMPNIEPAVKDTLTQLDVFALYVYLAELTIRIISYGKKPWEFFRQGWNIFDFLIVILSFGIFSGQTIILRLLRIFRLIRIFRFLPEVRVLTSSVVKSLPPLMSVGVLIFLALFIYGMAGVYLFGDKLPESWGNITLALTSLFILLTLENFPNYLNEAVEVSPWALPFYLSYIFIVVFTVLNVLIGIVLNAMDEAREENRERKRQIQQLDQIVHEVDDITADGQVTEDEIERLRNKLKMMESILHENNSKKDK
jgi:voltage-gated sodium channel